MRDRIKKNDDRLFEQIAEHIKNLVADGMFPRFFGPDVSLVPVPGHAPLAPGAVGTAQRIAAALARAGLGTMNPLLKRESRVTKSAWARGSDRPRAIEHFESLVLEASLVTSHQILLIDDFVTRGATFLGAASRICREMSNSEIKCFALVRSITDGEIEAIRQPAVGTIEFDTSGTSRRRA